MAAGMTTGPQPWWTLPGQGAALAGLQKNAPSGYEYDPVKMSYIPTSAGVGAQNSLSEKLTSTLSGLASGASSSSAGSGGGGGGTQAQVQYGGGTSGGGGGGAGTGATAAPQLTVPDASGAQNAAFARAKDQAGNLARSSVTALNDEMAGRGMTNSGAQNGALSDRLAAATNPLADVITSQMGDNYASAQHVQDLNNSNNQAGLDRDQRGLDRASSERAVQYQGGITQRGQDISQSTAQASLGQSAAQSQQALLLSMLKGLSAGNLSY